MHHLPPERHVAFEDFFIHIHERTEAHEIVISIGIVCGWWKRRGFRYWLRAGAAETIEEPESMRQVQRTVVMKIVADEPVRYRRLRRCGFEGRMCVDNSCRRVKTRIRNAPHTDASAVVGKVFDEPVDGVPRIGSFVDVV